VRSLAGLEQLGMSRDELGVDQVERLEAREGLDWSLLRGACGFYPSFLAFVTA
jgi:hypothetical protein